MSRPAGGQPRILLLSGASLVGQNVLASLSHRRNSLRLMAASSVAEEPILYDFDAVYLTPAIRAAPDAFVKRFGEVLAHCQPDLVIPCRDDDVTFLAEQLNIDPAQTGRFLCGNSSLAMGMLDKLESWHLANRLGLPFAPTIDGHDDPDALADFAAEHGFPLIVKPRRGFASMGVRLVLNEMQLRHACSQPDVIVQRYLGDRPSVLAFAEDSARLGLPLFHSLEETKLSLQAAIAPNGSLSAVCATGNLMRMGRSQSVQLVNEPQIDHLAHRWASVFADAGWRGPLNIQCQQRGEEEITIFEFNGRFTGATAARRLLGFDELGLALRDWLRLPPAAPQIPKANVVRYPVSWSTESENVERLLREGYWERLSCYDASMESPACRPERNST